MKFKGTWFLLIVAIGFGAYIYFIEIKGAAKDEKAKTDSEKIMTIDTAKIKTIALKNAHGSFALEKDGTKSWNITSPMKDAADENAIAGMLSALGGEKYDQEIDGEDLKTYGLDNPVITATFTTDNGKTEKLTIGIDSPLPGKIYIERNDDKKVLFADMMAKTDLDKELKELRDKRIFRQSKADVRSITIAYATPTNHSKIDLEKKDVEWDVNGPNTADQDAVTGLLNVIDGLRATDFPSEKADDKAEMKKYGLDKPEMVVTLAGQNKKVLSEIEISPKKDNNIYMKVAGLNTIFQAYPGVTEQLMHTPADFRDKKGPFDFKKNDVKEILIKTSLSDFHLMKKNKWDLAEPDPKKEVDVLAIRNFIDRINSFRVSEFVDHEKPKGLNPPQGSLVFKDGLGKNIFELAWGDKTKSGKSVFVKTSKADTIVSVDATSIATLPTQSLVVDKKSDAAPVPGKLGLKPPLPPSGGSGPSS